jgi:hypothetical protein
LFFDIYVLEAGHDDDDDDDDEEEEEDDDEDDDICTPNRYFTGCRCK